MRTSIVKMKLDENAGLSSNFCIVVRIRGEFSLEALRQALDCVRMKHRVLIPNAEDEDPASSHFPLSVTTVDQDGDAWKEIVKEELRVPFRSENGPFARFVWLRSRQYSHLIGTFHHGLCDGFSGVYVMRDVLQSLGDPSTPVSPLPFPPQVVDLIPGAVATNPRLNRQLRNIVVFVRASLWLGRLKRRIGFGSKPSRIQASGSLSGQIPRHLRMCILTHTLTDSQTAILAQRSKEAGVGVHAAVCTAWLRAFANTLDETASPTRIVSSPLSLRNRLTQPIADTAGLFMSTVETSLNFKPNGDFWVMARDFHARLKEGSMDDKVFMTPLLFNALWKNFSETDFMEITKQFFSRPVKYDFSITNLGRLDFPAQIGPLRVESFYNLVNSSEHERTVGVNTFDGKMAFILIFRESKMSPQEGEVLMAQAMQQLGHACGW